MELAFYAELNALCIAILTLLMVIYYRTEKWEKSKGFIAVLVSQCLFFGSDFFWIFVDGNTNSPIFINYLLNSLYFSMSAICAYIWVNYSESLLETNFFHNKKRKILSAVPIAFIIILAVTSPWTGLLYYITEDNIYHRGPLYLIQPILTISYVVFASLRAAYSAFKEKVRANKTKSIFVALFAIPPVLCCILQIFIPGVPILCTGITVSLVYAFITLQRESSANQKEIIIALTGDYEVIMVADLLSGKVKDYRRSFISDELDSMFGHADSFSDRIVRFGKGMISDGEKEEFFSKMSMHHLIRQLDKNGEYVVNCRLILEAGPEFYQIRTVATEDFKITRLAIVGLKNVDDATKHDLQQRMLLEEARAKAESANKAKSAFLFNMSHDIRTPMNAIIGFTAMAQKHISNTDQVTDYLQKIDISSQHLLKLINDVLDMARIESGKVDIVEVPATVHSIGDSIVTMSSEMAREHGVSISIEYQNIQNEDIFADTLHLRQIMINVVSNAIKYTNAGGSVLIRIRQHDCRSPEFGSYEFYVEDTGIGMSPEFTKQIFELFERERSATISGVQGTGLGMSIVKNLIDLMGGSVKVESELNVGTKVTMNFVFRLKYPDVEEEPEAIKEAKTKSLTSAEAWSQKRILDLRDKRVLVVEDNALNREIICDILSDEGMLIDAACDGIEAVDKIKNSDPGDYDFVLMDIQMPNLDGYEATRIIRSMNNKSLANIPIIAMTANAFDEDKRRAFEAGMNAHLTKPVEVPTLIETISGFIKK